MAFIFDSNILIYWAASDNLELLKEAFGSLTVPSAVWIEATQENYPGAAAIQSAQWIQRVTIAETEEFFELRSILGKGECEAICWAKETEGIFVSDDRLARKKANDLGIKVIGSLAILNLLRQKGSVQNCASVLKQLVAHGFYISRGLFNRFLKEVGEAD